MLERGLRRSSAGSSCKHGAVERRRACYPIAAEADVRADRDGNLSLSVSGADFLAIRQRPHTPFTHQSTFLGSNPLTLALLASPSNTNSLTNFPVPGPF